MITTFVFVEVAPCLTRPAFAAYLGSLCVVSPENNPNVSRYCDTDHGFRRGSVFQRPLFLPWTEAFLCLPVFLCAALCWQDCCTAAGAEALAFLRHNVCLCDEICCFNLHGYSHQCRPTQECQRGRAGRAGPEVQVGPSETHMNMFTVSSGHYMFYWCKR